MRENKAEAMEAVQDIKDFIHERVNEYAKEQSMNGYDPPHLDNFYKVLDGKFDDVFDKIDNL